MNQPGIEVFLLRYRTRSGRIVCIGLRLTCGIWSRRCYCRRGGELEDQSGRPSQSTRGQCPSSWSRCYPQGVPREFLNTQRRVSPYLDPPSSTSLRPSTIWWKSKTSCALSEMNSLLSQLRPWDCNASSSLKNDGRWTTTPFPISPTQFGFTKPVGRRKT